MTADAAAAGDGGRTITSRRRRRFALLILSAVALMVLGAALLVRGQGSSPARSGEIFLEAADLPGAATFTPAITEGSPPSTVPAATTSPAPSQGGLVRADGASPGLYGGTRDVPSCRPNALVAALGADPARAGAWAGVVGVDPADIGAYVATLTSAVLRVDTRVTDWSYDGTRAVPRQSILQAGTAVLLDRSAFPRARCASGDPLGEPRAVSTTPRYTGPRWPGFSPTTVVVVNPALTPPPVIILIDVRTGQLFSRIPGSIIIIDIDRVGPGVQIAVAEPGRPVTITGTGWPPGTPLTLAFDNPAITLATVSADGAGNFSAPVTVPPNAAPGVHQVTITGGGFVLTTPVYVIPPLPRAAARPR